ncbi:MAG TPA: LCP family protein [Candidatus Limnocylindria bacterium]
MVDAPRPSPVGSRPRRPWLAALLSFLFPGLGQAYAGRPRAALAFAVPALLLVAVVAATLVGVVVPPRNVLLSTGFLVGVLVANGAIFLWRSASIADAGLWPWRGTLSRERPWAGLAVIALLAGTLAMHAWIGVVVVRLEDTLTDVFAGADPGRRDPLPAASGALPTDVPDAPGEPVDRWNGTDRINILLLGTDAAPGRDAVLTDVILLVSVDPVAETAVMISVPRDTGFVPLPDTSVVPAGIYPDKVNGLLATATLDPGTWCPDMDGAAERCGLRTIEESVGLYLGLEIHHYALVDMTGFAELIDALGGLELCLPGRLVDPEFDGSLLNEVVTEPLVLPAGCHQYDGLDALAYARSRKGWIEMPDGELVPQNDFTRSDRQQRVLLALRRELAEADTFFELPGVLDAIGRTVSTDFPRDQAGDLASLVPLITGPDIERLVLSYPEFVDLPANPDVNYLLVPRRDAIRDEMERIFGADELEGWYLSTDAEGPDDQPATGGAP